VSPLHRPPKRGCPLLPWACSPVRWLKLSGLHSPSEEGMLTGRAVPFELRVHPTFSSAAARILQYITGALAPDSAPAPDALRCGPPSTAPLRPREVQDGSRGVWRLSVVGPFREVRSAVVWFPRRAACVRAAPRGAWCIQRSGFVLLSSSRCSARLPEGLRPCGRVPRVAAAMVPGLPSMSLPSPVGVWSEAAALWSLPQRSAAPPCLLPLTTARVTRAGPTGLIPCTTDWPVQMFV
jgi:hypothetical protein